MSREQLPSRLTGAQTLWLKVALGFALALGIAYLVPGDHGGTEPPVRTLLITASLIALFTAVALAWGIRTDLRLPTRVAVYAAAYNAIIVAVKFGLAPHAVYEVNRNVDITGFFNITDEVGAVVAAVVVFTLYATAYYVLYRVIRREVEAVPPDDAAARERALRRLLLPLFAGTLAVIAVAGAFVLLIPLSIFSGGEYLQFVFTSSVSLLIAVALAIATGLAALAFRDVGERAALVGDAALLVTFFWVGLFFLALYHALWVVYILVLTATWPLKVVVPK